MSIFGSSPGSNPADPNRRPFFTNIGSILQRAFGGARPGTPIKQALRDANRFDPDRAELERQQPIFEQMGPFQEPEPRGAERLTIELKGNPHKAGTAEYDRWILGLREDPTDPEYNIALRSRQGPAFRREEFRATGGKFGHRPGEPITPEDFEARELAKEQGERGPIAAGFARDPVEGGFRPKVTILGPDGQPLPEQFVLSTSGNLVPLLSEGGLETATAFQTGFEALQSGNYVWMGDMTGEIDTRFGERQTVQDAYMSGDDAILLPYRWSPEQVAYAQEAVGLDATGFVDQALISAWTDIVASAAGYTMSGRRVDPFMLLDMTFDATQAAKRGSGGGGGGGGAGVTLSQTTAVLNSVMLEEVGREATSAEAEQFHAAFPAAADVDPSQFATDWVRSVVGGEAAAFQVGSDYYEAMLQVLGSRSQAEEGPQ